MEPKHSRNKYPFDPEIESFRLKGVLPEGSSFPYDFGFIPSTVGEDGDPLEVLVLMDEAAPFGCVISVRLIGVIEAKQREQDGDWVENDRILAVATHAHEHSDVKSIADLPPKMLDEVEAFFEQYNRLHGKEFRPADRAGPKRAAKLVKRGGDASRGGRG